MKNLANLIDVRRKELGITKQVLIESLEMTRQGFDVMIEKGTISAKNLEILAEKLNVPISYFFDEQQINMTSIQKTPAKNVEDAVLKNYVNDLKEYVSDLKRQIEEYRHRENKLLNLLDRQYNNTLGNVGKHKSLIHLPTFEAAKVQIAS